MQATINGIDANRTNVVTVVETVKLRPDLSPNHMSLPARGVPGNPVNISVVLRELRGGHYFNLSTTATINLATGARTELTLFSSNRQAGDVTYHSAGYERFWDDVSGEEFFYTWNTTEVARAGTRIALGTHYGINISLTTGDGTIYAASPNVTLNPFDNSGQQPFMCFDWSFDEFSGTSCVQNERVWNGKHGFAFKDNAWVPQVVIQ